MIISGKIQKYSLINDEIKYQIFRFLYSFHSLISNSIWIFRFFLFGFHFIHISVQFFFYSSLISWIIWNSVSKQHSYSIVHFQQYIQIWSSNNSYRLHSFSLSSRNKNNSKAEIINKKTKKKITNFVWWEQKKSWQMNFNRNLNK